MLSKGLLHSFARVRRFDFWSNGNTVKLTSVWKILYHRSCESFESNSNGICVWKSWRKTKVIINPNEKNPNPPEFGAWYWTVLFLLVKSLPVDLSMSIKVTDAHYLDTDPLNMTTWCGILLDKCQTDTGRSEVTKRNTCNNYPGLEMGTGEFSV